MTIDRRGLLIRLFITTKSSANKQPCLTIFSAPETPQTVSHKEGKEKENREGRRKKERTSGLCRVPQGELGTTIKHPKQQQDQKIGRKEEGKNPKNPSFDFF